jgi:mannitol/fructose-specific phosphotransferase system IIA component (Ntr-type)
MSTNSVRHTTVHKNFAMAQKLEQNEIVSFKELLIANSIQVDALAQLLIEKGLITEQEFFTKLKQVQAEYESKKAARGS